MVIVRRTYPELTANHIKPLKKMLKCGTPNAVAKYNDKDKEFTFLNGSTITCKYCATDKDIDTFQGLECDILMFDEATLLSEEQLKDIGAIVRGVNEFPHRTYYTCNPNGQGLQYIKRIFIDREFNDGEDPEDYSFIQSLVTDNVALMKKDPNYVKQLESLPPKLKEAWLYGRWDVFEGAYFETFRTTPDKVKCEEAGISVEDAYREGRWTNVIEPFEIPSHWKIYRSYDWGYGKPFSFCWWAMDEDGVLYQILEWYGCTKTPNEGVRMTNAEQFKHCQEIEANHRWLKGKRIEGVADPSIWDGSHDTDGISCAETAESYGIFFEKGNNERIAGWMQVRERLKFDENGKAMLYFFDTCKASVRCFPLMMHDEKRVEDLDTTLEDHACLVGNTLVLTEGGYKPISELVGTEGYVCSSDGKLHKYNHCRLTKNDAEIYEVALEDGTTFRGTIDHPILTTEGWVKIGDLLGKDVICR